MRPAGAVSLGMFSVTVTDFVRLTGCGVILKTPTDQVSIAGCLLMAPTTWSCTAGTEMRTPRPAA